MIVYKLYEAKSGPGKSISSKYYKEDCFQLFLIKLIFWS